MLKSKMLNEKQRFEKQRERTIMNKLNSYCYHYDDDGDYY